MRHITTTSTSQLATAIANAEARETGDGLGSTLSHLVRADEDHVAHVKGVLDDIVEKFQSLSTDYDKGALRSTQAAEVQDAYLQRKLTGAIAVPNTTL